MEWIVIILIGAVMGTLVSFLAREIAMPQPICIIVGIIGAIAGGALFHISGIAVLGSWSVFMSAALVAIGFLVGAVFAFFLTATERRV